MNSWIEEPEGGRDRGLRGLLRAWMEVLVRPRRFFANGIAPGDQAPGLTFAAAVAAVFVLGWVVTDPSVVPVVAESPVLSAAVVVLLVTALAAPVGLHLTAALATVSLVIASLEFDGGFSFRDRGGVSETVQVVAYASAPMVFAGPAVPVLRIVCGGYATLLLFMGFRIVHGTTPSRTVLAGVPPAAFGYGVGYRIVAAIRTLFGG